MREVQNVSSGQKRKEPSLSILYLEDNLADARLLMEAFKESSLQPRIEVVEDGERALAVLRRQDQGLAMLRPDLFLLDLRLPRKGGLAVLMEVRADPILRDLPAMVFTSSLAKEEQQKAAALGVERFLHKPVNLEAFFLVAQEIAEWWREKNEEPNITFY